MQNSIKFYAPKFSSVPRARSLSEFSPDRPKGKLASWLQRLCWRILLKLGCTVWEQFMETQVVEIKPDTFADIMDAQMFGMMTHMPQVKYLLVGREQMRKLRADPNLFGYLHMPPDYRLNVRPASYELMLAGVHVVMVPWMDGVIPLPDLPQ